MSDCEKDEWILVGCCLLEAEHLTVDTQALQIHVRDAKDAAACVYVCIYV